jgi:hypothetical protein
VVDEPVKTSHRNLPVHFLVDVEGTCDRLVVGGMESEGPVMLRQQAHYRPKFLLHDPWHVGTRLEEVLEIRGRKDQHFSSAVVAKVIVALPRTEHAGPVLEVDELAFLPLGEKVVGNPNCQFTILVQLLDNLVVVRVVLEPAACVNRTRDPESIELTHEVPSRV